MSVIYFYPGIDAKVLPNCFISFIMFDLNFFKFKSKLLSFYYRLVVLGKLNNLVKEWISDVSESKVRLNYVEFFVSLYWFQQ